MSPNSKYNRGSCPRKYMSPYSGTDDEALLKFTSCTDMQALLYYITLSRVNGVLSRRAF